MKKLFSYFKFLKPVRGMFAGGIACGVLNGWLNGLGIPVLIYKVYPVLFAEPKPETIVVVGAIAMAPVVMILRGITSFFSMYMLSFCGVRVRMAIQSEVYQKIQKMPLAFFHQNSTGDILSRTLGDTGALQAVLTRVSGDLIKQPVQLLSALGFLIYLSCRQKDALVILLFLAAIPACVVPLRWVGRKLLKRAKQLQDQAGDISRKVSENLSAVREVRAFNLEDREVLRLAEVLRAFNCFSMKVVKYSGMLRPAIELVGAIGVSIALVYMITKEVGGEVALPLMAALYFAYEPLKKFGEMHNALKKGEAALQRIEYILNEPDSVPEPDDPEDLGVVQGAVSFEGVKFRYLDEWVLKDVNVAIPAGTVVALVGPSGAGKSTFVDLIPRFYDVEEGRVCLDGHDLRTVRKKDVRAAISVVSQDTFLFNETITENIRVGRSDATDEEVRAAAKHAFAHEFILGLEEGYETVVGERGVRLSGGQKQRISIARAFLKCAPILILDEATSALDSESEEMVQKALESLVAGKTVFIIAHRFSTIKLAEKILVFDEGAVQGVGSHETLYAENDLYRKLYDKQFID